MNLKKFISGVSALAIAASAFAGMAVTANAAEVYYSEDFSSQSTTGWLTGTSERFDPVVLEEGGNYFLSVNQANRNNNGTTVTRSSLGVTAENYTMTFKMRLSSSTNQAPVSFKIYDSSNSGYLLGLTATRTWATTWIVNEDSGKTVTLPNSNKGGGSDTIASVTWCEYKITLSEGKTYLTITNAETNDEILPQTLIATKSTAAGVGKMEFVTKRYFANFAIDDIVVREIEDGDIPDVAVADFSVKYVTDDGITLTKTSSGVGVVDEIPSVSSDDKADFVEDGQKYIYVSDNAASQKIAADESTVVTITVRAAASYDMKAVATVDGADYSTLSSRSVFEGDTFTYAIPKYITDEANKVIAETALTTYSYTVSPTASDTIKTDYTSYKGTAYFVDHEDITTTATLGSGNYSGGSASRAVNGGVNAFTVAEAGTYTLTVAASCRNTSSSSVFAVYKNSVDEANLLYNDDVKGTSQNNVQTSGTKVKENIELSAGDVIIIQGDNGQTWIDYVLLVRTDAETTKASYSFTKTIDEAKELSVVITATNGTDTKSSAPIALAEFLETFGGKGSVALSILIKDIPEGVTVKSVALQ